MKHVFLDTNVFVRYGYNFESKPFSVLTNHVKNRKMEFHTTDITLFEIKNQIRKEIHKYYKLFTHANKIFKKYEDWFLLDGTDLRSFTMTSTEDEICDRIMLNFQTKIVNLWDATEHEARFVNPQGVFDKYFHRIAPFDTENSKEFCDAFVIESLSAWCESQDVIMYFVSDDKAIHRASALGKRLVIIDKIEELMDKLVSESNPDERIQILDKIKTVDFLAKLNDSFNREITEIDTSKIKPSHVIDLKIDDILFTDILNGHVLSFEQSNIELLVTTKADILLRINFLAHGATEDDPAEFETTNLNIKRQLDVSITIDKHLDRISKARIVPSRIILNELEVLQYAF